MLESSPMTTKAILFDLGDTLLNYGNVDVHGLFNAGGRLAYEYLDSIKDECNGKLPGFGWYLTRHLMSIRVHCLWSFITCKDFNCLSLLNKRARAMSFSLSHEQLTEYGWKWYQPLGEVVTIERDLHQRLADIRQMGIKIAIVSNTFLPGAILDRHLKKLGLLESFDARIYSCDTQYRKPHRIIYQAALEALEVKATETLMVGDKVPQDIKGPGKLGVQGIFKRGITNSKKPVPAGVKIIDKISELPELLASGTFGQD